MGDREERNEIPENKKKDMRDKESHEEGLEIAHSIF
jgi:hypothetical protein